MGLVDLLLAESRVSLRRLGVMAAIAGGSNAGILAVVNAAAANAGHSDAQVANVALFALAIFIYLYAQRYVLVVTTDEVEEIVHRYRERLLNRLMRCELQGIEHIGRGLIYSAIGTDTQVISQCAGSLVLGVQAAILIFWAALYLATLSLASLGLTAAVLVVAGRMYQRKVQSVRQSLHRANQSESTLHDLVNGLLDGFKEVKLSHRRAEDVLADAMQVAHRTAIFRTQAQRALAANFIFAQTAFFILLGTLVFVMPAVSAGYAETIMKSLTAVMFLIGPISGIITAVPQITMANAAADNLCELETRLESLVRQQNGAAAPGSAEGTETLPAAPGAFRRLELRRVLFRHGGAEGAGFSVGPIDFTLRAGEVVFITGGNGSGKTTFMKLLTALYPPAEGEVLVDGVPVTASTAQAYRDRFCAVFSDFHLFRKLYGIDPPDPAQVAAWLAEMEIADKVGLAPDGFSTVDLSSGQRKRLALVSALLEDKPIIVLDEWAADQDPHFRAKFYQLLLPRLKAAGKTVIAITHDERYFGIADRRLHMEEGQLTERAEVPSHG